MVTADHLQDLQEVLIRENALPLIIRIEQPEPGDDKENQLLTHPAHNELAHQMPDLPSQILVPIKRESEMNGVIYLATTAKSVFTPENIEFLSRLSDHAAIAISNAQLYAEVQAANKAKSEFVSAAAHELKNPLTSIKGYSDLLVAGTVGPVNEGQAGFLTTIRSNAERMRTLVSDLQDISRIEAGQLLLNLESHSLDGIVQEVAISFEGQIVAKEQQLVINLPEDLPLVWCDNTRMVQVLTNLVSNANKYSPPGGLIGITAERIIQTKEAEGTRPLIQVSVADNGFGISREDQKKLFEQFFRSEDSRIRESTGTGLGLSITKRLVEIQGGKLWFETELGHGTTFYFTVPAAHND
jgi:signal transduction histidine kinase